MTDFDTHDYVIDKIKAEPRVVHLADHDHVDGNSRNYVIADKSNQVKSAVLSTTGIEKETKGSVPELKKSIDLRFKNLLTCLFGDKP